MTTNKLLADFNRYFTSSNGVDVPDRVSVPRDEWRALHAALSSQGAGEAAQPARVVDERDAALNLIMKMCNDAKEPCSTDPESAGAIRNGKFASIAGVAAQGLGLIRGPSLSTPPAAPTPSQAGAVTELEDVKRWFMNPETGMLVQTERGPWVRYVDVLAAFEAKKAVTEQFSGHQFKEVRRGVWRCECGKQLVEGRAQCTNGTPNISTSQHGAGEQVDTKTPADGLAEREAQDLPTKAENCRADASLDQISNFKPWNKP